MAKNQSPKAAAKIRPTVTTPAPKGAGKPSTGKEIAAKASKAKGLKGGLG